MFVVASSLVNVLVSLSSKYTLRSGGKFSVAALKVSSVPTAAFTPTGITKLALFRNTTIFIKPNKRSYNNPIQYTENPLLSGYISTSNLNVLKNSVPFQVQKMGSGRVIVFTDNTNFRAFWYGTNKLLMNAIFFGSQM